MEVPKTSGQFEKAVVHTLQEHSGERIRESGAPTYFGTFSGKACSVGI